MLKRLANLAGPGMLIGLGAIMGALYGADRFLASLEQREISAEARRSSDTGKALMRQGKSADAVEAFRHAHVLERDNHEYETELADALIGEHHPDAAIETLESVLDEDSNDGTANLLMARAMRAQNHSVAADSYYHRAIYGTWPAGEEARGSAEARLELVRWLAAQDDKKPMVAELIPLEESAKSDPAIAREIPAFFLKAGSLTQAEDAYRALLKSQPDDAEAYAGLGRVELQKGNYRAALGNFDEAIRRGAEDPDLKKDADLARIAHDLDPTIRHLTSVDKLARSNQILAMVAAACPSPETALPRGVAAPATNEMAEARLDLAEKVWHNCKAADGATDLLALLMKKIAQ
jgi:cytochrome c-type biogenesis protein CcmH/NrfG